LKQNASLAWPTEREQNGPGHPPSRDQEAKLYVQHRMLEHADELWAWLQEGAHFYVCGDAKRMANDVDAALKQIVQEQGGMTAEDAAAYVANLTKTNRYQRDVY